MSRKIPPETFTYASGGGAGSRLEIRTSCGSPTSPASDGVAHGLVGRVEAAVEADLERHAGRLDRRQRAVDLGEVERDGLLAEDRLAGARRGADQLGVRVRARADRDRVDVGAREQLVDADGRHAELRGDRRRGLLVQVG